MVFLEKVNYRVYFKAISQGCKLNSVLFRQNGENATIRKRTRNQS